MSVKEVGGLASSEPARLLELLVRIEVYKLKGERNKTEMVLLLGELGFSSSEIVAALNVPMSTVAPIVSKAKRAKSPRSRS
jgi:DNA-directed RNA polymerase specialized sigma24 family protein